MAAAIRALHELLLADPSRVRARLAGPHLAASVDVLLQDLSERGSPSFWMPSAPPEVASQTPSIVSRITVSWPARTRSSPR